MIATATLFLASDESSPMTGAALVMEVGITAPYVTLKTSEGGHDG